MSDTCACGQGAAEVDACAMLETHGLSFSYNHRPILRDLSFQVGRSQLCAILGNNGVGKSTLLKCLLGVLRPQDGSVLLESENAAALGRRQLAQRVAYVAQQVTSGARLTVFDAVLMGRRPHITWAIRDHDLEVVREALETLGLEDFAMRYVDQLSGGETQKVVIARALAQEPSVLLLDEPTSNLDLRNQMEVMRAVRSAVEQRGIAALMAIHDINLALRFADRFVLMKEGRILACGGREIITPESVRETYGVSAVVERVDRRIMVIPDG